MECGGREATRHDRHRPMSVDTAVIIVTFESQGDIGSCLDSLCAGDMLNHVIVVDNCSRDATVETVRTRYPAVRLLRMDQNVGFAAACNRGIRASQSRFCLFVNPDVRLAEGAIDELVGFAEATPRLGVEGPRVFDADGHTLQLSYRSFPTIGAFFFNRFSLLNRLFPQNRWRRSYLLLDQKIVGPTPVDWVSGCCMLVRRETLDALGGFDERFFMYNEDVDLCMRAKVMGWKTYYNPRARITHQIGASSKSLRPVVERHKSAWRYYRKHMATGHSGLDGLILGALTVRCSALVAGRLLSGMRRLHGRIWTKNVCGERVLGAPRVGAKKQ